MDINDQIPMCCNCKKGKLLYNNNYILCPFEGIVSLDYFCKKFEFDVFKLKPRRNKKINFNDFSHEDFSIL